MFGRKRRFEPDGYYDGFGYRVDERGRVDVNLNGRIVQFDSVEDMLVGLHSLATDGADLQPTTMPPKLPSTMASAPIPMPATPPQVPARKSGKGCGCFLFIILGLALTYFVFGGSDSSKVADVINSQFGGICEAKVEGISSNTLRLDWTAATTKFNVLTILAAIGKSKETLYSKGIRYLKYPNDAGTYNIIDWKTGQKSSDDEHARYYFRR
jgi:hypothetical protein